MEFNYKDIYKYPTHILLNVTDDCNLACRYCFAEQHPHYMTLETAKKACDWGVSNYLQKQKLLPMKKNEELSIYFFGGEPTLMFEPIIRPLIKYMEDTYKGQIPYSFGITTNGTLLNQEKIEFLSDHQVYILLSCDGNEKTQNYNRPCRNGQNSFDLIKQNFYFLLKKYPDITFRSTVYAPTVENLFNNYIFAELLGFKSYYCMPDERHSWTDEQKKILAKELEKIFWYRCNQYLNNINPMRFSFIDEMYISVLNVDTKTILKESSDEHTHPTILRCGLGTTSIAVGYDGNLYGCQEQPSKDKKNIFLIGNLYKDNGINYDLHYNLLNNYYNAINLHCDKIQQCNNNCQLRPICYNKRCPSVSWELFNDFDIMSEVRCLWRQLMFKNCQITMKILTENNCKLFKEYLYDLTDYKKFFELKEGE